MKIRKSFVMSLCAGPLVMSGCRMGVPVHSWKPPEIESTVGKQVVVARVAGPKEQAEDIKTRLIAGAPKDAGRATTFVDTSALENKSQVQLATASDTETSDVVLASVARAQGYDYVLQGEVLADRRFVKPKDDPEKLTLSWRLFDLGDQRSSGGAPIIVDTETAIQRYPDLAIVESDEELLRAAAVRDTYRLIAPSIQKDQVQLAIPYLLPGSKEIRRGIIAAHNGRWNEAEEIWSKVAESPFSPVAATHNLALAAAAGQDFSRAKKLARSAIRRQPTKLHKETLVWIELRQRDYHKAFNLPDPPEGWFVTKDRERVSP